MSSPEVAILRFLLKLVWFVLRLLIYAVTNEWVGKNPFASDEAAEPQAPAQGSAAKAQRGSPQQQARLTAWLVSADTRVNELRKQARITRGASRIEQMLARDIEPLITQLKVDVAQAAPAKRVVERIQALDDALQVLAAGVQARADTRATSLADSEALAEAWVAPLYEYARSVELELTERTFVALPERDPARAQRVAAHSSLFLVGDAMGDASQLGWQARSVARMLVDDLPGLIPDLQRDHRLPAGLFLPAGQAGYDMETARGALGVWLPELAADVLATFMVGPPYVRLLSAWLSKPNAPLETRLAYANGRWLSPQPPSALRMFAATRALEVLGFTEHASAIQSRFDAAHGAFDFVYYPLAEGRAIGVPATFVLHELAPVIDALCSEPQDALADETLLDVPGFVFLHGEEARASDAAARFLRGEPATHAVRECASGALAAALARPDLNQVVFAALARSVRGAGTLEAVASAPAPSVLPGRLAPVRSLRAAARDRHELRAAMMLSAALSPRRAGRRR